MSGSVSVPVSGPLHTSGVDTARKSPMNAVANLQRQARPFVRHYSLGEEDVAKPAGSGGRRSCAGPDKVSGRILG